MKKFVGYDRDGFDMHGRDRWGYDWWGFDATGHDREGRSIDPVEVTAEALERAYAEERRWEMHSELML